MRIYLDHNATAPPPPEVIEAVGRAMRDGFGNASSVHAYGQRAKALVDEARSSVAALMGGDPSELIFTSGGTEADNLALRGAIAAVEAAGRRHLVVSGIEHEAVLTTARALERSGCALTVLPVSSNGVVDPEALRDVVTDQTALVSVMHANNEVGTIQPIAELAAIAREHGAWFHTDAVQSAGKIPVAVRELGVDLLSISGHKFGAPQGCGALWIRRGVRLVSQMTGGRQERSRRAGTENVAGLSGFGVAARLASARQAAPLAALRDDLERQVLASIPGSAVNGDPPRRVPNTSNISFDGLEAESLLIALDLEGIAVSTGSACSSGSLEPSHVLRAMGLGDARARSSIRFSLGSSTTADDIRTVVRTLPAIVEKLRRLNRAAVGAR